MMDPIRSLAEFQSKFQPNKFIFAGHEHLTEENEQQPGSSADSLDSASSTDGISFDSSSEGHTTSIHSSARLIEYRGEMVASFEINGVEMICLPQVYELFLKNMVGGLHTVYTKLKRLEITPIICGVEQVRALRSLGAIQPGVNRCKLISTSNFDTLYEDCNNTCTRPGRPPKRLLAPYENEWTHSMKRENQDNHDEFSGFQSSPAMSSSILLGQFLPQLTAQHILMQQMAAAMAAQRNSAAIASSSNPPLQSEANGSLMDGSEASGVELGGNSRSSMNDLNGTPLNLSNKTTSASDNSTGDTDSLENMRKMVDASLSPSQFNSDRGGSSSDSNSNNRSPSQEQSSLVMNKVISLIDIANDHFKQQTNILQKEKEEIQHLRVQLRESLIDEQKLKAKLEMEKRKSNTYFNRYCKVRREVLDLKEMVLEMKKKEFESLK